MPYLAQNATAGTGAREGAANRKMLYASELRRVFDGKRSFH
jgi:hypothetical protein